MLPADCIVAALLLTAPPELPMPDEAHAWAEACRVSIVVLAVDAQVLDIREAERHLTHPQSILADLRTLQARYRDFAFAPLVEESLRFPDRASVNEYLAFNRAYRADLQSRVEIDAVHAVQLRLALKEADELFQVWTLVAETRWAALYVTARRQALQLLHDQVGAEAFYSGRLPPYVPVWRIPAAR